MKRVAYSMNIKSVPVAKARAYAEKEFSKAGMDLDELLPNFDKNYRMLQKRLKSALDIPRIAMPVIEPTDMALFNQRLNAGSVDIFAPYARGKLYTPTSLSTKEGEEWVNLGYADGQESDDVVRGALGKISVKSLKPTQSEIWFDKIIGIFKKFGIPGSGSIVLSQTVIVSKENYILDGHHRYGQAMLADPNLKMRSLKIPLSIDLLLQVGKSYGEAIGNKPKASIQSGQTAFSHALVANELVGIARTLSRSGRCIVSLSTKDMDTAFGRASTALLDLHSLARKLRIKGNTARSIDSDLQEAISRLSRAMDTWTDYINPLGF